MRATESPLATLPAPANQRDHGLLAPTLDAIGLIGPVPARPWGTWTQARTTSHVGNC